MTISQNVTINFKVMRNDFKSLWNRAVTVLLVLTSYNNLIFETCLGFVFDHRLTEPKVKIFSAWQEIPDPGRKRVPRGMGCFNVRIFPGAGFRQKVPRSQFSRNEIFTGGESLAQ